MQIRISNCFVLKEKKEYENNFQMNPNLGTKVRQSLHWQLSGVHILIFVLNSATVSDADAFISSGTISQILGARKDIDSVPY